MKAQFFALLGLILSLTVSPLKAAEKSSESLSARKGLFHLLSADVNEESEYAFRASGRYFLDGNLWEDQRDAEGIHTSIAFGYSITENFYLSGQAGFTSVTREENNLEQSFTIVNYSMAPTYTYDIGKMMDLDSNRLLAGASLWVDFSKISRFFKGLNIHPNLMLTTDWSDLRPVPVRAHFNLGFKPKSTKRFFDENSTITDLERTATRSLDNYAITTGLGVEFPTKYVRPTIEANLEYIPDANFSESPKWATLGLKSNPFPQKNIEIFAAAEVGLADYKSTVDNAGVRQRNANIYAVPQWTAVVGFGLKQFGKLPNEVGIDRNELKRQTQLIMTQRETLRDLRDHLRYNTVRGRVLDSETRAPIPNVTIDFPEQPQLGSFETNDRGEFTRYFPNLEGNRIRFKAEGYAPSSKFLVMKPGESVRVDIELSKARELDFGDYLLTITDNVGRALEAQVKMKNLETEEVTTARSDATGRLNIKIAGGEYNVEISKPGYRTIKDRIELQPGKAVIRVYNLRPNSSE